MTSTSVHRAVALPATAASPPAQADGGATGVSGGGLTPLAGQGFVPLTTSPVPVSATPATSSGQAPAAGQASTGTGTAPAGAASTGGTAAGSTDASGQAQPQGIDPKQGLAALKQKFGDDYSDPIVAANGNVYMESRTPEVKDGKVNLRYELVARIDSQTGKMLVNPDFLDKQTAKPDPNRKLVKQGDQYFWQVMAQGADGQLTAKLTPASQADLQEAAAAQQQQTQQEELQAWNQDKAQWIQKLGFLGGWMKTIGYTGGLVDGLSRGPNPYTGQVGSSWLNGYMILQMLDAQGGGKLLPQWMKTGPVGESLSWGTQALFMMDMGHDLQVLGQALPRTAAVMRAFTAPTRSLLHGVTSLVQGAAKATAPAASVAQAASGAAGIVGGAQRIGLAGDLMSATQQAGQAAGAAAGAASEVTAAVGGLGKAINSGAVQVVGAGNLAGQVAVLNSEGALQLVPKGMLYEGMKMQMPPATGLSKVSASVNNSLNGAVAALRPALRILQIGGSIFGTIAGALNIGYTVKNSGAKALVDTRDGRGALTGFLSSAAFLGMMMLPSVAPTAAVAMSALNVASNVFAGVSMLNYAGLFGEGGWLDHDAVRAAFLIPPLTPIGMFAMWMKKKQKVKEAQAKQLEANKTAAVSTITTTRKADDSQLQQAGKIDNAQQQPDGSLVVATGVSSDLSKPSGAAPASQAPQPGGASGILGRALHMAGGLLHS